MEHNHNYKKDYIIVKDRHPRISEVLNDCITLCVPASKNEPLSSILQKICGKITNLQAQINDLPTSSAFLEDGEGTTVSGAGTEGDPWMVNIEAPIAINGMSVTNNNEIVLGQDIGEAGDPAVFLSDREIPMNDFTLNLNSGILSIKNLDPLFFGSVLELKCEYDALKITCLTAGGFPDIAFYDHLNVFRGSMGANAFLNEIFMDVRNGGIIAFRTSGTVKMFIRNNGIVNINITPVYADNAAALLGGLLPGDIYRTGDDMKIVH